MPTDQELTSPMVHNHEPFIKLLPGEIELIKKVL